MNEKSEEALSQGQTSAEALPEAATASPPRYRKPRLVPHGQLKPAGFLLGSPPDPP